jgi:hypothetical protein
MKEYIQLTQDKFSLFWFLIFYKDSKLKIIHRKGDKPAIIWSGGVLTSYKDGKVTKIEVI